MNRSLIIIFFALITVNLKAQETNSDAVISTSKRSAVSMGYCMAGGSYLGADFEMLVSPKIGLQAGIGYLGYEGGINFHFSPSIHSTFLSLKYWHQGIGEKFRQDAIGTTINIRAGKIIATQLGLGFPLSTGPAMKADYEVPKVMLLYSIGVYFTLF
jgi:hypothetical protein